MSIINPYLNQLIIWKKVSGYNDYNEPTFDTFNIYGRWEKGHKLITDKYGQELVSTALVLTTEDIGENDKIGLPASDTAEWRDDEVRYDTEDARKVIEIKDAINIDGVAEFRQVYLQ